MFYTYIWRNSVGIPFYVGKGMRKRAWDIIGRSAEFKVEYAKGGCSAEIVDEFILESQAHAHEMELIARYGRREFGGLLVNKTDGGDGVSGRVVSEETRGKLSEAKRGVPKSIEHIAKMSAANQGKKRAIEGRSKTNVRETDKRLSLDHAANVGNANRGKKRTTEQRSKLSKVIRSAGVRTDNASGFKGVSFHKPSGRWAARIRINIVQQNLGTFATPEDAARSYDAAAYTAWGTDCYLNFPEKIRHVPHKDCGKAVYAFTP